MKIALVGSAPSSVGLAPYRDKSFDTFIQGKLPAYPPSEHIDDTWEIWACSPGAYGAAGRMTRFFEVHRWEPGATWFSPEYCQFLREFRGPVYTGGPIPEIQNAVPYPIDQVELAFSPYFLTSSLALMLGLAILEIEDRRGKRAAAKRADERRAIWAKSDRAAEPMPLPADEFFAPELHEELTKEIDADDVIGMWGVDMSAGEEWEYQRPGCQFFLLEALRRGICVFIPPESDILRPQPIYGMSEWDQKYIKATVRSRELNQRAQHSAGIATAEAEKANYLRGAIDNMNYFIKTHMSDHGLPAGIYLRHEKGSGLGNGMVPFGARILVEETPTPLAQGAALAEAPKASEPTPPAAAAAVDKAPEAGKAVRTKGPAKKKKPARTPKRKR